MSELEREIRALRLRLTAGYVLVFGSILLAFGLFIYHAATVRIAHRLDQSLERTVSAVAVALGDTGADVDAEPPLPVTPEHDLYLFDGDGTPISPSVPPDWLADAVRHLPPGTSRTLVYDPGEAAEARDGAADARALARSLDAGGRRYVLAAVGDAMDLDDRYAPLLATLGFAALAALVAIAVGGYLLSGRAAAPLDTSFQRMRQFTATAAHQMRNPLASIRATAEAAVAAPPDSDASGPGSRGRALERVASEAERLGVVLDRLLVLARSDAKQLHPGTGLVHLDDVAYAAVANTHEQIDGGRPDIHLEIDGECSVTGDETLLGQMLSALLENAVKHAPRGTTIDLTLLAVPSEGRVEMTVRDRGPGIPADLRERIFEPFVRAGASGEAGVGLGLSIARRIADAHGGLIAVENPEDGGARLRVSLPLRRARVG